MRRLIGLAVVVLIAPVCTSIVASADETEPVPPDTQPAPPPDASTTTTAPTSPTTTTTLPVAPPPESTAPAEAQPEATAPSTTLPASTAPSPAVTDPPTQPTVPTVPPTVAAEPAPADAVVAVAAAPAPPVPLPPDDAINPDPPAPPSQAPSGRIVVPAGAVDGGQLRPITFPVAGPVTYVNDFGACRDGCRRAHRGNDVIGDRLQPLLAMHDGVIDHLVDHPTAGYGVVIRDAEGWEYRVYHVNNDAPGTDDGSDDGTWRFPPGIVAGAPVRAGQLIGWVGDSGNSESSVPHAHVEIIAPGGVAVNPYWSLRRAQRDVNCRGLAAVPVEPVAPVDAGWLDTGWLTAPLPEGWRPLTVSGGRPRSAAVAARMWINPLGYTPVDAASLRVGDARYDDPLDCGRPETSTLPASMPAEMGAILATIRAMESGGNYTVTIKTSTASGAYGFLDSSWGRYGGYARAKDAPPEVQDAKAAEYAVNILNRNGGDVSTIPVSWYIGHVPVGGEWDRVPPYPGNRLTPREYQERWLRKYTELLGSPDSWVSAWTAGWKPVDTTSTCHTVVVDVGDPEAPHFVLTQAQPFIADAAGRAVPSVVDTCDPTRRPPAPPASELATLPDRPRGRGQF